jgi:hypothetical protein
LGVGGGGLGAGGARGTRRRALGNLGHDCRERSRRARGEGNGKVGGGARRVPTEHTENTEGDRSGESDGITRRARTMSPEGKVGALLWRGRWVWWADFICG